MKALSIKQPWAWLIVKGYKDIENRNWYTNYRGPVLIHTGRKPDNQFDLIREFYSDFNIPDLSKIPLGGIVGYAKITDCISKNTINSRWFQGPFGFVLKNARELPFVPMSGQLNFFEVNENIIFR